MSLELKNNVLFAVSKYGVISSADEFIFFPAFNGIPKPPSLSINKNQISKPPKPFFLFEVNDR